MKNTNYTVKFIFVLLNIYLVLGLNIFAQSNEDCLTCHSDNTLSMDRNGKKVSLFVNEPKFSKSTHGQMSCVDCHEGFDAENLPHKEGKNIAKVSCIGCHDDKGESLKNDIHQKILKNRTDVKKPDCTTCHSYHYVAYPNKSTNKIKDYCNKCHQQMNFDGNYHNTTSIGDESCSNCHKDTHQITEKLSTSIHKGLSCVNCHSYVEKNFDQHKLKIPFTQKADCSKCHNGISEIHKESIHGIALSEGITEAAYCWDCHGSHQVLPKNDINSTVNVKNLSSTCGNCHDNAAFVKKFQMTTNTPAKTYSISVHGKLMNNGQKSASCITCHTAHNIKNRVQPNSTISSFNIPTTCEQCHKEIVQEYKQSIHWNRAKRGIRSAPVCNDCHGEHSSEFVKIIGNKKDKKIMQEQICVSCHEDPLLTKKFGLTQNEAVSYQDSYHGLAAMRGDDDAARCIDCHGVHKILPKNNPQSTVNILNITNTCKKCHTYAKDIFSQSYSHVAFNKQSQSIEDFVSEFYIWMIFAVIGGMVLHNLIIFIFEIRKRKNKDKNAIKIPRFTKNEVIQHYILLTSFITLTVTGFALKYPTSWWSSGLLQLGMTETVRQNIHRTAAVIMMGIGLYHIVYLLVTKRGRDVLFSLIPKLDDVKDVVANILYNLHLSKKKPEFDTYDYAEKAEYWALIWGTIVMGITGLFLWFPTLVGDWAPFWLIKVSEIIHFYEAILATLAILVWHWFFVIFHPSEYPMSFTWIDGKMTLAHYRHHHPKHFKRILVDWLEMKMGKKTKKDLKYSTMLFTSTLEKNNLNPDTVFENELNSDFELREWVENKLGPLPVKD